MTKRHRLFYAIRPDEAARSLAVNALQRQTEACTLSGHRIKPECLHVTLHLLGDYEELPDELVRRAKLAAGSVEVAPFDVGFDRIGSLGPGIGGVVLTGAEELKPLRKLQRTVAKAMTAAGIGNHIRKRFNPHVSLLYCDKQVECEPVTPIRWRVDELVLVHSLLRQSKHIDLGSWRLQTRQLSFSDW